LNGTFPNTVLSDVHRFASGAGTTVAVLNDLSNGKSRVAYPVGAMNDAGLVIDSGITAQ